MSVSRLKVKYSPGERSVSWESDTGEEVVRVVQQIGICEPVIFILDGEIVLKDLVADYVESLQEAQKVLAEWDKMTGRTVEHMPPWTDAASE